MRHGRHRSPRGPAALATALAVAVLAGCSSSSGGSGSTNPATSRPATADIAITYKNGTIDPEPNTVTLSAGTHVHLTVSSDVAEEVHNHYNDKEVEVPAGGTATFDFVVTEPGVYEVELHHANKVLVKLQVE